ncbi:MULTISPECIES: MucB/RseB C-terminal domain-containing protein [Symbiopectobacterium]|uniref:MucB/RseB C-terminal domain-containing protein n=1 Tax=Symbiopectobacterium TaxID=801 RepID=UPI0020796EE8|nr:MULTISPECIES: MucB/RseB C-terminal domain-containing protein [Symbiopectobacterium]
MKEISRTRRTLPGICIPVESRLFSDGLFSFSVNITPSSESRAEQYVTTGRRSVHTEIRADNVIFQSQ